MGVMKFNTAQQRGIKFKELGPNVGISVAPSSSYQEKEKALFFNSSNSKDYSYFLADGQGSKLCDDLDGNSSTLMEYMNKHGVISLQDKILLCKGQQHTVWYTIIML